jgi:hypothetical protein
MPTFFIPSCPITATPKPTEAIQAAEETQPSEPVEIIDLSTSTETAAPTDPLITPAPAATATTECDALIVCVDGMVECGEGNKKFE